MSSNEIFREHKIQITNHDSTLLNDPECKDDDINFQIKGIAKGAEPCKCVILFVSRIL